MKCPEWCGKEYKLPDKKPERVFCSEKCFDKWESSGELDNMMRRAKENEITSWIRIVKNWRAINIFTKKCPPYCGKLLENKFLKDYIPKIIYCSARCRWLKRQLKE